MKAGDLTAGTGKLQNAWKRLREQWDATGQHWHDSVSHEFEERYLNSAEPHLRATLEIMRGLSEMANAARAECDPERLTL